MLYFEIIPKELLEIIISKINNKSFLNLLSILNIIHLDYNHILKLKYPKLLKNQKIYLSDYINVLSDHDFKYIEISNHAYIIFDTEFSLVNNTEKINDGLIHLYETYDPKLELTHDGNGKLIITKELYQVIPKIIFVMNYIEEYINPFLTNEEKDILPSVKESSDLYNSNLICIKTNDLHIYDIKKIIDSLYDTEINKISIFTTNFGLKILYLNIS
jgi:hypothetical protein